MAKLRPSNFNVTATDSDFNNRMFAGIDGLYGTKKLPMDLIAKQSELETTTGNVTALTTYAQNVAASIATEFDTNKPNDAGGYAYYAGSPVMYKGSCYVFTSNKKSGAWDPAVVEKIPISEAIQLEGVGEAVAAWLDEHPEATTTVEDGSLVLAKFTKSLKLATVNDFVYPEMFGAKGDNSTDDTLAFADALATGKKVVGTAGSTYRINGLVVDHGTIIGCKFRPYASGNDGIILKSFSVIKNCTFTIFRRAIVCDTYTIHSIVERNIIQYSARCGVYIDVTGSYSINNLIIANNYINRTADSSEDPLVDDLGCGIYANGNFCGLFVRDNVIEYSKNHGISLNNSGDFRPSAIVTSNYFEGNGGYAVKVNIITNVYTEIAVVSNFFNTANAGIYTGALIERGSSCYDIEDHYGKCFGFLVVLNGLEICRNGNSHRIVLDSSSLTSRYAAFQHKKSVGRVTGTTVYIRVTYTALNLLENTPFQLRQDDSIVRITFENGFHQEIIPYFSSWYFNRLPREGEKIIIENVEVLN